MALARWQATIVDAAGNIVPLASVEVRREVAGAALASLFSDRDGLSAIGNPFSADAEGFVAFHVAGGSYKVRAYVSGFERIWRYVGIGTAAEFDATIFTNANRITARAATTANIAIATALNDGDSIDGVTLATGDAVLVKSQTAPAENGLYVVGVTPARHADFDTFDEHAGALVAVSEGTANANKLFFCAVNAGGTLDTTALPFTELEAVQGDDGAPGSSDVTGTSASSVAIGTGTKTFTVVEANRGWAVGARLRVSSDANPTTHWMEGVVTAYSGVTLEISADLEAGSGSRADWTINLAGEPGANGLSLVLEASAVGGTANAIELTVAGMGALSATPQFVWFTPGANNTTAVTIKFNGGAFVDLKSPRAAALAADDLQADVPYLIRVTSTDAQIRSSGASF